MDKATLIARTAEVKARPAPVEPDYTGMQWNAASQARLEHVCRVVEHASVKAGRFGINADGTVAIW
jgi:predicted dienelactone hydrolase